MASRHLTHRPSTATQGCGPQRTLNFRIGHGRRSRSGCRVFASSESKTQHSILGRRELGAGVVLSSLWLANVDKALADEIRYLPVQQLGTFQRSDVRRAFLKLAENSLKTVLTSKDASNCLRLVWNDAGTYNVQTSEGGMDGSVVLSEELNRPENSGLKDTVEKLKKGRDLVNSQLKPGQSPISWADVLVVAGKVTHRALWREQKIGKSVTASGGNIIADAFGADWPIRLGRLDSNTPNPPGRLPAPNSSIDEITKFTASLAPGSGFGPFAGKPKFSEPQTFVLWPAAQPDPAASEAEFAAARSTFADLKKRYDYSRRTITRTDYEVDFIDFFARLTSLGAKFDPDAYLYPIPTTPIRF